MRKYHWRYHILVVDNHFYNCYSFFLQAYHYPDKLHYSYDLVEFEHNKAKYGQVLKDLKEHNHLSIEYRDTDHLVHPGTDVCLMRVIGMRLVLVTILIMSRKMQ